MGNNHGGVVGYSLDMTMGTRSARTRRVLVAAMLAIVAADPGAFQTPAVESSAKAKQIVERLAAQDFASVVPEFNETMKKALTEERLRSSWTAIIESAGAFKAITDIRHETRGTSRITVVVCSFERFPLQAEFAFDAAGLVAGFNMRPAVSVAAAASPPPPYADANRFTDREVVIGSGEWTLPGTLSLPTGAAKAPALILVHGSGPLDRDATVGPNKPFRDLAAGLASRGIAVLRYEKRTRQYSARMAALKGLTVKDEVVDDVLAAAAFLRQTAEINGDAIFVLGHSLGGTVIPRIAAADRGFAGFVVLAGLTRPLVDTIAAQVRYLALADGTISDAERKQIADVDRVAQEVKKLGVDDVMAGRMIGGAPATYWLDLRGYDPAAAARAIDQPMLILQGERDYQVTMVDFKRWQEALSGRKSVTFKSYPPLNHLFMPGTGPSLPAEYQKPGHVAEDVVRDIAVWITK
jgi:dienelactone hydrolase